MSEGHIARHRNYGLLMKRHHRDLRIRRLAIVLIYLLLIIAITVLFLVVKKEEQHRKLQQKNERAEVTTSWVSDQDLPPSQFTIMHLS